MIFKSSKVDAKLNFVIYHSSQIIWDTQGKQSVFYFGVCSTGLTHLNANNFLKIYQKNDFEI